MTGKGDVLAFSVVRSLEALLVLSVALHAVLFSWSAVRNRDTKASTSVTPPRIPGLVEAEQLKILNKSREFTILPQNTTSFALSRWSGDNHLFFQTSKLGDSVELALPVPAPGRYRLIGYFTRSFDFGKVQITINGKNAGEPLDLSSYGDAVFATGPLRLGEFDLTPTENQMKIQVVGRDPNNRPPHYLFAMDGLKLERL